MFLPNCLWTSTFQRIEYGFSGYGLKNVKLRPRKVARPSEEPVGVWIPLGKGLSSVEVGRKPPVAAAPRIGVDWLKPLWFRPVDPPAVPIEATNTPAPARTTGLPPAPPGVPDAPKRGLM